MAARWVSGGALAALLAVAACGLFPDLSALRGGDAGASTGDGATSLDGSADATSGPLFCASSHHDFCSDFDDGQALPGVWDTADPGFMLTMQPAKSPPWAAHGTLPQAPTGKPGLTLQKTSSHAWTSTVLEFDVFMAAPQWNASETGAVILALIEFPLQGSNDIQFFAWVGPDDNLGVTAQQPAYMPQESTTAMTFDRWTHVRLTVDPRPPGSYELAVGDPPSAILSQATLGITGAGGNTVTFGVGLEQWNTPAPALDLTYDDVTLDFH